MGPSSLLLAGESFDTCSKAAKFTLVDIQVFNLADLLYFQWGSLGPLRMMGKLNIWRAWLVMRLSYLKVNILSGSFVMRFLMRSTINICECGVFVCLLSSLFGKYCSLLLCSLYHLQLCDSLLFGRIWSWKYTRHM